MDRRTFLLSALGLTAAPEPAPWSTAQLETAPPPPAATGVDGFEAWRLAFIEKAAAAGYPRDRVGQELATVTLDDRVVAADRRQPELSRPIGDYMAGAVSPARIEQGRARRAELSGLLSRIAERTGVPPEILVAVWAVESNFGQVQGNYDVVRSLATLAADGRRREWAESQLLAALRILISGEAPRDRLKGSWAGAMGQTQFMPDTYLSFAVDEDGDGRRDIWGSTPDALGSTGNYLQRRAAWRRGQSWALEVLLPEGFDYGLSEGPMQPPSAWAAMGVRPAGGRAWKAEDEASPAQLILPAGWQGPAFLALPNHMAIRVYNNSTSYALAVGLLADAVAGSPGLARAWPQDQPLTLADRMAAQSALAKLGFDPGGADGVLGTRTRAAARAWQKARGRPADGYLSWATIQALKQEAGLAASAAAAPAAS